ncbi:MAG: Omp28-related outer membrane protein [Sphingobacteriales bacterium]|nr:MAG: Omp28-related outer membrane protein [Sphingobacteriales bacterium]
MKALRFAALALAGLIGLASCEKELGPAINFNPAAVDTTYVAPVEAATLRRVLVEEFTGVTCPNCPAGHLIIKNLIEGNPGRISAIGFQPFNIAQANPSKETRIDNRTQKGTDLSNTTFGSIPFLPCASIDRVKAQNSLLSQPSQWTLKVTDRMKIAAPMNIDITSTYDSTTRELKLKVHMAYTADVTTKNGLTVALVENHVVDAQESTNTIYDEYDHEHVFRDFLTATAGDAFLNDYPTKTAGRVVDRYFTYTVDAKWKPENCVIVAYVHNAETDNIELLQVAEKSLK